jgi:pimeloyl-ACP methyl ester carboxylesterase/DNA-binding CsgD family transcriptional regulator
VARDLVDHLYDTSLEPERLVELIEAWDARIRAADPADAAGLRQLAEQDVIPHVARALTILDRISIAEAERVQGILAGIDGAALVVGPTGIVIAANRAAQVAHALFPGESLSGTSPEPVTNEIAQRLGPLLARGIGTETVVTLRSVPGDRLIALHLRVIDAGRNERHLLAVSSECLWPDRLSEVLSRAFGLTSAETGVLQAVVAGDTVAAIAARTRRSEKTVRAQIHALLAKTGTRSQTELVRLSNLLLRSVPAAEVAPSDHDRPILQRRSHALPDGRRCDVFQFGTPMGAPVVWMQSTLGFFVPTRSGEAELRRRGMRVIVPVRAGFGDSAPFPPGADVLALAVADSLAVMDLCRIERALVVAPVDDIRIALDLAHAAPERIRGVVAIGAGFPIQTIEQYRRLHVIGRFFRVCARYTPQVLPFAAKAFHAWTRRFGVEAVMRKALSGVPGDARAFAQPEVAEAIVSGFSYLMGGPAAMEAFCAEVPRFHEDWPAALGRVRCPVLLIHGDEDQNAPVVTAREYCARYPSWRLISFPGEGELVAYSRAAEVLDLVAAEIARTADPAAPPHR